METKNLAYEIIADFMNKYDALIKPNLAKGNLDEIKFLIGEVLLRSADVVDQKIPPIKEPLAYAKYRMAMQELNGLFDCKDINGRRIQLSSTSIERHLAELDLILSSNLDYKRFREN